MIPRSHEHDWYESDVHCGDCGSHPALRCRECDEIADLVRRPDPRDLPAWPVLIFRGAGRCGDPDGIVRRTAGAIIAQMRHEGKWAE